MRAVQSKGLQDKYALQAHLILRLFRCGLGCLGHGSLGALEPEALAEGLLLLGWRGRGKVGMGVSGGVGACTCGAVCASTGKDGVRVIDCALIELEKNARGKDGLTEDCAMLGSAKHPSPTIRARSWTTGARGTA